MSVLLSPYSYVKGLYEFGDKNISPEHWVCTNEWQRFFVSSYLKNADDLALLPELDVKLFDGEQDANQHLASSGYSLTTSPHETPNHRSLVTTLGLSLTWAVAGVASSDLVVNGIAYQNAHWKNAEVFSFDFSGWGNMAVLTATNGDKLCVIEEPEDHLWNGEHPWGFMNAVYRITSAIISRNHAYKGLIMPECKANITYEKDELPVGIGFKNKVMVGAKHQLSLEINKTGAEAKAASAFTYTTRSFSIERSEPLVITKPYLAWVTRRGMNMPIFVAYVNEESWIKQGE